MTARVYVPTTIQGLATWFEAGAIPADAIRVLAAAEDEDSEYDALMTAAATSADRAAAGRRVVVVAETGDSEAVGVLALTDWVAVHCDVADRPADAAPDDDLAWFASQEIPDLL